jgi:hypothetical protein
MFPAESITCAADARTVALPGLTPVTMPEEDTVTMEGSLLSQDIETLATG